MIRLSVPTLMAAAVFLAGTVLGASHAEPPPFPLTYELKPVPSDTGRLATAGSHSLARAATIRQTTAIACSVLYSALLLICYFSGFGRRLDRRNRNNRWLQCIKLAAVATVPAAALALVYAMVIIISQAAYGLTTSIYGEALRALLTATATFAAAFGVASMRRSWPKAWWVIVALTLAAAAPIVIAVPPRPARNTAGGHFPEAVARLATLPEYPATNTVTGDPLPGRGPLSATYYAEADVIVAGPAAEKLDLYEAEYLSAYAMEKALAFRRSLFLAALLLVSTASLAAAEIVVAAVARRRKTPSASPYNVLLLLAFLVFITGCWSPVFKTWKREMELTATETALEKTRLPAAAVSLAYKEVLINQVPYRPPRLLHVICDDHPSPAERVARAYAVWDKLM